MSDREPVLIISADAGLREALEGHLSALGDRVEAVARAEDAPAAVAGREVLGAVVDLACPGGPEILSRIRLARPGLLLVALGPPAAAAPEVPAPGGVLRLSRGADLDVDRAILFPALAALIERERERRPREPAPAAPSVPPRAPDAREAERRAEEDRRVMESLKTGFIGLVSHELRTPLSTIIGFAEILANRLQESEADFDQMVQGILRSAMDLERFLTDAMEFLQWTSGTVSLSRVEFDFVPRLQRIIRELSLEYREQDVRVVFRGLNSVRLWGDARVIASAIERVLENAFRSSPAGGVVEVSLQEETRPPSEGGATMVLKVRDQGIGLHRHELEKLFEPLTSPVSLLHRVRGQSLGLALAREGFQSHGGRIAVHSEGPQKGCLVVMELSLGRLPGPFEGKKIPLGEIPTAV